MAFDRISPIGMERFDYLAAIVACSITNRLRGKGQRALSVSDFVPKWGGSKAKAKMSPDDIQTLVKFWANRVNQHIDYAAKKK